MPKRLGPILYLADCDSTTWRFHVQVLVEGKDNASTRVECHDEGVKVGNKVVAAAYLRPDWELLRWTFEVKREIAEREISYVLSCAGKTETVAGLRIPPTDELPNVLFFSCNGFSSTAAMKRVDDPEALWRLACRHHREGVPGRSKKDGYHLMLGGGDQIYADGLFSSQRDMRELFKLPVAKRKKKVVTPDFEDRIRADYARHYVERWKSQKEFSWLQARVPGLYTWDDHDIFDGWGSYEDELNDCPAYQAIFRAARSAFETFQLGGRPDGNWSHRIGAGEHFAQGLSFECSGRCVDLLLLDLRSDRRFGRVLSEAQWADLQVWLNRRGRWIENERAQNRATSRHLVLVSSIPLVFMRFGLGESILRLVPGQQELEDDLRDQWESPAHRGERDRLLMTLLAHSRRTESTVTILSGDVHVGARGRVRSQLENHRRKGQVENHIEQITSSGIVHPAPSGLETFVMRLLGGESEDEITAGVWAGLGRATAAQRYIEERNFLSLSFDQKPGLRLWAQWHTEGAALEPQVVLEA